MHYIHYVRMKFIALINVEWIYKQGSSDGLFARRFALRRIICLCVKR